MERSSLLALLAIAGAGSTCTTAIRAADALPPALDVSPVANDDRWRFSVAPYLWGASLNGDVTIGPVKQDVDLSFRDILEDLSIGAMLYAEARKSDYGVFTNMFFVRTRDDSGGMVDTQVTSDTAQIAVGGFYRVVDWQWGETSGGHRLRLVVEPLAGRCPLQLSSRRGRAQCGGPVNLPYIDRSESFVDPMVGLWIGSGLPENWLVFRAYPGRRHRRIYRQPVDGTAGYRH